MKNDTLDTTGNITAYIIEELEANKPGEEPDKTPFKQPKLAHLKRVEVNDVDTVCWVIVEEALDEAGGHMLTLDGQVEQPPVEIPCSTLWQGASMLDHLLVACGGAPQ